MPSKDIQEIVAIPLKYGSSTKPLKTTAIAQLVAKALYVSTTPLSTEEVAKKTAELIGEDISIEKVKRGLNYLHEDRKAFQANGKWALSPKTNKEIYDGLDLYRKLQARIIERFFPKSVDEVVIGKWFDDASITLALDHHFN